MFKVLFGGSIIAVLMFSPVMANTPVLSGKYAFSSVVNCGSAGSGVSQTSGLLTFDPTAGTVSIVGNVIDGDPPVMRSTVATVSFSNTSGTITVNGVTYQATFGKLSRGIATYLTYIGVYSQDGHACGAEGWLSRRGA
jgi:hypothetical protein